MLAFRWSEEKNTLLKRTRGIGFEEVVAAIDQGYLLDLREHPNKEQYAHQKVYVVMMRSYVYIVPFVESETEIFLKTIIPSRKETRRYLGT